MASREERLAQNQESFRHANARLEHAVTGVRADSGIIPFLCECADDECLGRIEISLPRYDEAHRLPRTYVILTGHPRIEGEEIIEDHGLFEVVQKR